MNVLIDTANDTFESMFGYKTTLFENILYLPNNILNSCVSIIGGDDVFGKLLQVF